MRSAETLRGMARKSVFAALLTAMALPAAAYDYGETFGYAGGWSVDLSAAPMGGCMASPPGGVPGDIMSFHLPPAGGAQLAIPSDARDGTEIPGRVTVGGQDSRFNWYVDNGMAWGVAEPEMLTELARAGSVRVTIGQMVVDQSLAGSTAAMLMLQECWIELGRRNGLSNAEIEQSGHYQYMKRDFAGVNAGASQAAPRPEPTESGRAKPPTVISVGPAGPARSTDCPAANAQIRSPGTDSSEQVAFFNRAQVPLTVYWFDFDGNQREMLQIRPGGRADMNSFTGHLFVARDSSGSCHGGLLEVSPGGGSFSLD